jgi:hypothetical protein
LGDRHFRPSGENVGELALTLRVEMHDNHESSVDVVGEIFKKHLQGMHAPGGCSDAHRRKPLWFAVDFFLVAGRGDAIVVVVHSPSHSLACDNATCGKMPSWPITRMQQSHAKFLLVVDRYRMGAASTA